MKRLRCLGLVFTLLSASWCGATEPEKDVPYQALAEIARRGALVERIAGYQDAGDPVTAISAALAPPADDSHKWMFTLVTARNCPWCQKSRADFESDARLKAWIDTRDYTRSWAHWQVVQIEDQSQAWRWKDFRPTVFPTLIVQPPVNGSWGDPHTAVFVRQGYLAPTELDAAIRGAIQRYAAKTYPQHKVWAAREGVQTASITLAGFEQAGVIEQASNWNPPVAPPVPLPAVPNVPAYPLYPNIPPEIAPQQPTPSASGLLSQLLAALFGGQATGNLLLIAILAWQLYRGFAKTKGIPLVLDDTTAAQLMQLLQSLRQSPAPQSQARSV
jgi:hypothetical protein